MNAVNTFHGSFSFGKSKRSVFNDKEQQQVPSAQQYDQSSNKRARSAKIGTSKRPVIGNNLDTPSIGTYDVQSKLNTKGGVMAKRYEEQDKSFRVGPGSYSLRSEQDMVPKKKTSLGYRFEHKWAKTGAPGPAQYTINTEKKNFRKTHTFGHGYKDTIYRSDTVNNPPPTKYNKNYSCVQTEQSVSFTKGYREAYYLSDQTPGPNQYFQELESSFKKSGISFNSKHQKKETESGPGPGCYNPLRNNSTPTCRIGTQKKLVLKANKHPGPGSYDLNEKRKNYHKGSTFQKGLKKSFITFGENPGPADYIEEYSSLKGPKVKMVFKQKSEASNDVPGPGSYEMTNHMNISREYSFTQSNRKSAVMNRHYNIGPGSYNIIQNNGTIKSESQKQHIRQLSETGKEKPLEPGPGYYNIAGDIGYQPKYLL